MTALALDRYTELAALVAARVDLDALAPCAPSAADEACARALIEAVGTRAFRRPPDPAEVEALLAVFDPAAGGAEAALRLVVEAMVQSPHFIYHLERGTPEHPATLDGTALASRLSYLLFDRPPDDALRAEVLAGDLQDPARRARLARDLLRDPRARAGVTRFVRAWLDLEAPRALTKDLERYPSFDVALAEAMLEETDRFSDFVIREGDGRLETLLTASFSFVPSVLRPVYGLEDGPDGLVALDPGRRAGVLTHASVLASHARFSDSSPVLRGVFLYRRLLCGELAEPPPGLDTSLALDPDAPPESTAAQLARHREEAFCATCHDAIDPLGLAFEHYGALGEWREDDEGLPILPPPPLSGTDVDGPVESAVDLARRFAASRQVQDCAVTQWLRFTGLGLTETEAADLRDRFQRSDHNLRDLMVATVASPAFVRRRAEEP